ncbi:hypothetical protein ABPG73_012338 [Tetrahymena malaccensis]
MLGQKDLDINLQSQIQNVQTQQQQILEQKVPQNQKQFKLEQFKILFQNSSLVLKNSENPSIDSRSLNLTNIQKKIGFISQYKQDINKILKQIFNIELNSFSLYDQTNIQILKNETDLILYLHNTQQPFHVEQKQWVEAIYENQLESYNNIILLLENNVKNEQLYQTYFSEFIAKASNILIIVVNNFDRQTQLDLINFYQKIDQQTQILVVHYAFYLKGQKEIEQYEQNFQNIKGIQQESIENLKYSIFLQNEMNFCKQNIYHKILPSENHSEFDLYRQDLLLTINKLYQNKNKEFNFEQELNYINQFWQYSQVIYSILFLDQKSFQQQRNALIVNNKDASQYQYWKLNSDGFITKTIILQGCDLMNQDQDNQLLEASNQLYYFIPSKQNYYLIDINNLELLQDQATYTCGTPLSMTTQQGLKTNYLQSNNLYVRIAVKQDGTSFYDTSSTFTLLTDSVIQNMNNLNSYWFKDDIQDFSIGNSNYFFWNGVQYQNPTSCKNTKLFIVDKQNSLFLGSCLQGLMYLFNINLNAQPLTLSNQYIQPSVNTSYSDIINLDSQTRIVAICWAIQGNSVWWFFQTNVLTPIMSSINCQNQPQNQPIAFQNYFIVDNTVYSISKNTQSLIFTNTGQLTKQYLPSHAYNYSQRFYKEKRTQILIEQNGSSNTYFFISMDYLICGNNGYLNQQGVCLTCSQNQVFINNQCSACQNGTFYQNQQCSPCSLNCNQCDSLTQCSSCNQGYYLSQANQCVQLTCPDNSSILNQTCACNSNYYKQIDSSQPQGFKCVQCTNPCKDCLSNTNCLTCQDQYYLSGSTCIKCLAPCLTCISANQCQSCQDGYYISNSQCTNCISPCLNCTSSSSCSSCQDGYYLSGNSCQQCSSHCTSCTSNITCLSCSDGYFTLNNSCSQCESSCRTCTSLSSCSSCNSGYFLDQNKNCSKCQQNFCVKCQDSSTCQQCQQGYFLDTLSQNCRQCTNNCNTCQSSTYCLSCLSGYYLEGNSCTQCNNICTQCTSSQTCSSCIEGYFLDKDQCIQCDQSCQKCSSLTNCSACANEYYLNSSGLCKQCQSNCSQCQDSQTCLKCQSGYFLDLSSKICTQCTNNCQICSSPTQCQSCLTGYKLYGNSCLKCIDFCSICASNDCPSCIDGYFLVKNSCQKCIQNCINCQDSQSCNKCQEGFNLYGNMCLTSSQCPTGCKLCQDNTSCQICLEGYIQQNQQCMKCSIENCSICDNQQYCLQCKSGFKLVNQTQICIKNCGIGYYLSDNNECLACDQTCQTCQGPKDTDCITCKSNLYLSSFSQKCLQCEDQQYLDNQNNCQNCFTLCQTCSGPSSNQCTSCKNQLVQSNQSLQCITQDEFQAEMQQQYFQNGFECTGISNKNLMQICEEQLEFSKLTYMVYFYVSSAGMILSLFSLCFDSLVNGVLESSNYTRSFWLILECRKFITVIFLSKYLFENNSQVSSWTGLSVSIIFCLYIIIIRPLVSKVQNFTIIALDFAYNIILIMIGVIISGKYQNIQNQFYLNNYYNNSDDSIYTHQQSLDNSVSQESFVSDQCLEKQREVSILRPLSYEPNAIPLRHPANHEIKLRNSIEQNSYRHLAGCSQILNCILCPQGQCNQCQSDYELDSINNKCCNTIIKQSNNECVSCPPGQFEDNQQCSSCPLGCLECKSLLDCKTCDQSNNYYLFPSSPGVCQICNIQNGYFNGILSCQQCYTGCSECSGPLQQNCNKCNYNYQLQQYSCIMIENCHSYSNNGCNKCYQGYYIDNNRLCSQCSEGCLKCTSQNNSCQICDSSKNYYLNVQLGECFFCDVLNGFCNYENSCQKCYKGCSSCTTPSQQYCITCIENYYQDSTNICQEILNCDLAQQNKCMKCKNGYFLKPNGLCYPCQIGCITCESETKCITCDTQNQYAFQDQIQTNCQLCNQSGYFIQNNVCTQCSQICEQCNGSSDKCIQCYQGYILDNQKKTCFQIIQNCKQQIEDTCKNCNEGYYLDLFKSSQHRNSCVCKDNNQIIDSFLKKCVCKQGFNLDDGNCVALCSKQKFNNNGICQLCDSSCYSCKGPTSSDCLSCHKGFILQKSFGTCGLCEEGQFFNNSTKYCDYCDYTCLICTGQNKTECLACQVGLQLSKITNQCEINQLIESEQDMLNLFLQIGCYNQTEQKVDQNCYQRFEESFSKTKILEILAIVNIILTIISSLTTSFGSSIGLIYIQSQQIISNYIFCQNLNPLWINQLELKVSYTHHLFTLIPNFFKFTASKDNILFSFNNYDTYVTVNNFYKDAYDNCLLQILLIGLSFFALVIFSCLNKKHSLSVTNNENLLTPQQVSEQSQMMHGYFKILKKMNSLRSTAYILEDDLMNNIIYIIFNQVYVIKMTCYQKTESCINQIQNTCQKCIDGYYLSTPSNCAQCPKGCLNCTSDTQCQTCDTSNNYALQDGQNICSKCQVDNGYYIQNGKCSKCYFTCNSCSGNLPKDCQICNEGYILDKQEFYQIEQSLINFFRNSNSCVCQGQNQVIDIYQKKCVCKQGFVLDDDNCQTKCSKQKYYNNGVCQSCDSSCSSCKGPKSTDCQSCHKGFVLLPSTGSCGICEEGQFYNSTTKNCYYCHYTCLQCTGQHKSQCTTCKFGLMLSDITSTCELDSQVQSEQELLNLQIQIGCYSQTQKKVDQNCYEQFEESLSQTKTLEKVAFTNIILIFISSICTSFGSSLGLMFIQNQQVTSNYLFSQELNPLWINQLELKFLHRYLKQNNSRLMQYYCPKFANCASCDNNTCLSCIKGYLMTVDTYQCCKSGQDNCGIQCLENQYQHQNQCFDCPTGCLTCTSKTMCQTCVQGYILIQNQSQTVCQQCTIGQGFFLAADQSCRMCFPGCSQCIGQYQYQCTKCNEGFQFRSGVCISITNCDKILDNNCQQCKKGYYLNSDQFCVPCPVGCLNCNSDQSCTECDNAKNYYLQTSTRACLFCNTLSGQLFVNDTCQQCFLGCSSCSVTSQNCITCSDNYYLDKSQNICLQILNCDQIQKNSCLKCKDGYYINSNNACSPCPTGCLTCQSQQSCQTCDQANSYYFSQSSQVCNQCNISQGYSIIQQTCLKCFDGCSQCKGPLQQDCLACEDSYYLQKDSNSCQKILNCDIISGNTCKQCSKGYYLNSNQQCVSCSKGCLNCKSGQSCLECDKVNNYYLQQSSGICQLCSTSQGYIFINDTCQQCFLGCSSCFGTLQQNCITCNDSYYLDDSSKICQKILNCDQIQKNSCLKCKDGYYINSNNACSPCPTGCLTCQSQQSCQTCDQANNYYFSQSSQVCNLCNISQGYSIIQQTCLKCFDGCSQCKGPLQQDCLACEDSYYLQKDSNLCQKILNCDIIVGNTCKQCKKGYYLNSNQQCVSCSQGCLNCKSGQSCLECDNVNNYYLQQSSGICQFCSTSQGYIFINDTCQQCFLGCSSCFGTLQQNCITCNDSYYLDNSSKICQKILNCDQIQKNSCLKCKDGYYINSNNTCSPCPTGCLTCQSQQSCQTCDQANNYYFSQSSQICNPCNTSQGYYVSEQICLKCFDGCSQCKGPLQQDCLVCEDSYYLQKDSNSCQKILNCDIIHNNSCLKCQDGYYINSKKLCSLCPTGCLICESELICKSCDVLNKYTFLDNSKSTCILCKQPGQFILQDQCTKCNQVCAECNGSSDQCTSCRVGFNFDQKKMTCYQKIESCSDQIQNICQKCIDGYYLSTPYNCAQCQKGCLKCTSDIQCQTCDTNNNYAFYDDQTICSKCQVDKGYFIQNDKCSRCHFTCSSCNGPSPGDCQICNEGYTLNNGDNCQAKCSMQKYNNNGLCQSCDSSCRSCKGPKSTDCLLCNKGLVLLPSTGSCGLCQEGQFYNYTTKNCDCCHYTCLQCTEVLSNQRLFEYLHRQLQQGNSQNCPEFENCAYCDDMKCFACKEGYLRVPYTNQCCKSSEENCGIQCKNNQYQDQNQCFDCPTGCLTCTSQIMCQTCVQDYVLIQIQSSTVCSWCPVGQGFFLAADHSCRMCFAGCSSCIDQNQDQCTNCKEGFIFQNGQINNQINQISSKFKQFINIFLLNYLYQKLSTCIALTNCDKIVGNTCQQCKNGYYLNSNQYCIPCSKGCLNCNPDQSCTECDNAKNYYLQTSKGMDIIQILIMLVALVLQDAQVVNLNNLAKLVIKLITITSVNQVRFVINAISHKDILLEAKYAQNVLVVVLSAMESSNKIAQHVKITIIYKKNGYYINSNKICNRCPTGCFTCESEQICKSCDIQNKYAFLDNSKTSCILCQQPGKMTCYQKIVSCISQIQNTCQKCIDGYYLSTSSNCAQCPKGCLNCTSDTQCQTCDISNNYALQDGQTICSKCQVDNGYYIQNGKCSKCYFTCNSCSGTLPEDCQICNQGYILDNKQKYNNNGVCQSCDSSCSSCKGPKSTDCQSCHKGFVLLPSIGSCGICEEGQFYNSTTKSCYYCHYTCLQCTGQDKSQCTTCTDGLMLSNITSTCELNSKVQSEQELINLQIQIGCYSQTEKNIDQNCYEQFEESLSKTKTLEKLAFTNIILIFVSSICTSFGSSLGLMFIQNQQVTTKSIKYFRDLDSKINNNSDLQLQEFSQNKFQRNQEIEKYQKKLQDCKFGQQKRLCKIILRDEINKKKIRQPQICNLDCKNRHILQQIISNVSQPNNQNEMKKDIKVQVQQEKFQQRQLQQQQVNDESLLNNRQLFNDIIDVISIINISFIVIFSIFTNYGQILGTRPFLNSLINVMIIAFETINLILVVFLGIIAQQLSFQPSQLSSNLTKKMHDCYTYTMIGFVSLSIIFQVFYFIQKLITLYRKNQQITSEQKKHEQCLTVLETKDEKEGQIYEFLYQYNFQSRTYCKIEVSCLFQIEQNKKSAQLSLIFEVTLIYIFDHQNYTHSQFRSIIIGIINCQSIQQNSQNEGNYELLNPNGQIAPNNNF